MCVLIIIKNVVEKCHFCKNYEYYQKQVSKNMLNCCVFDFFDKIICFGQKCEIWTKINFTKTTNFSLTCMNISNVVDNFGLQNRLDFLKLLRSLLACACTATAKIQRVGELMAFAVWKSEAKCFQKVSDFANVQKIYSFRPYRENSKSMHLYVR